MSLERKDRRQDTTTTTGTGTVNLGGTADTGYLPFDFTNGATVRYLIQNDTKTEWEVGEGVFTDAATNTLSRVTIYASSNAGSAVNFSAGTKKVFCTLVAEDLNPIQTGWNKAVEPITITDEDTLTIASVDKTLEYGKGVKVKQVFTGGDNTHSLDLEAGSSQYASIADANQTGLDITGDISIEAWIKLESTPGNEREILNKFGDANNLSYRFYLDDSPYVLKFQYSATGTAAGLTQENCSLDMSQYPVGTWIHVAVVADVSTKEVIFYINGIAQASTNGDQLGTSIYNGNSRVTLGANSSNSNLWDGLITEVRVWNDIRTASEIRQNMFHNVAVDSAGLVGYWKLDNDYLDETANNNDLTASGSPVFSTDVPAKLVSGEMFFNIIGSIFGTATILTLTGGIDYYAQDATSTWYISYVENPQGFPDYFNWDTTHPNAGTMTFSRTTLNMARFKMFANCVKIWLDVIGTTGGTATTDINFTLPIPAVDTGVTYQAGTADTTFNGGGFAFHQNTSTVGVRKQNASNWGLGTLRRISTNLMYLI